MKVLIGILSCHKRAFVSSVLRETWLDYGRVDYRFFFGSDRIGVPHDPRRPAWAQDDSKKPLSDEVFLVVPDDLRQQPIKTRAMVSWAYNRGYDFLFKCDDDTYVRVPRLLASGFEKYAYSGHVRTTSIFGPGKEVVHAQGGAGYWIDRACMEILLRHDTTTNGAEDINVARVLLRQGISPVHDARYSPDMATIPTPENDQITAHNCGEEDLRTIHSRFTA